jgi:hypothetical protein
MANCFHGERDPLGPSHPFTLQEHELLQKLNGRIERLSRSFLFKTAHPGAGRWKTSRQDSGCLSSSRFVILIHSQNDLFFCYRQKTHLLPDTPKDLGAKNSENLRDISSILCCCASFRQCRCGASEKCLSRNRCFVQTNPVDLQKFP